MLFRCCHFFCATVTLLCCYYVTLPKLCSNQHDTLRDSLVWRTIELSIGGFPSWVSVLANVSQSRVKRFFQKRKSIRPSNIEYCDRCKDLASYIYEAYIFYKDPKNDARRRDKIGGFFEFDVKMSIGCPLCALIVNNMSEDELEEYMEVADSCLYLSCQPWKNDPPWQKSLIKLRLEIRLVRASSMPVLGDIFVFEHGNHSYMIQ